MGADDHSGAKPAGPVVLRIKLRYDDVDTMVQKFASNVGKAGLFLPTKSIQPIGTEVKFELRLANDTAVLVGLGRVKHVKPPDPAHPKAAFGMAIELTRVSREGRAVILKMLERRRALGLPEVTIPIPEDVDAARRSEVESQGRADTSGIVRDAMRDFASAPVAEQILTKPVESKPIESKPVEAPAEPSMPVTLPAVDTSKPVPVPTLAPERSKPSRPRASDLLAKANALAERLATVDTPGLDAQIDLDRALARARAIAGSDLDRELAALRESAAAPLAEISIEAASAELARQLGGKPITKRERSAKWVALDPVSVRADSSSVAIMPPASPPADGFIVKTRAETEASPSATIAAVTQPAPEPAPEPDDDPVAEYARDEKTRVPTGDDYDAAFLANAGAATLNDAEDSLEVPVEQPRSFTSIPEEDLRTTPGVSDDGEARKAFESSPAIPIDENDLEAVEDDFRGESTHVGGAPTDADELGNAPYVGVSHGPEDLSAKLDRELAEADAEVDAEFRAASAAEAVSQPYTIGPYPAHTDPVPYEPPAPYEETPRSEEVSDHDVLAEADARDADLMAAHGERDASNAAEAPSSFYVQPESPQDSASYEMPGVEDSIVLHDRLNEAPSYPEPVFPDELPGYQEPPVRPSQDDFASRLDLGDDDDEEERRNFPTANPRPATRPPPLADLTPSFKPHDSGEDFDEPHGFSKNTPVPASPRARSASRPPDDFEQPARPRRPSWVPPMDDASIDRALSSFDEPSRPPVEPEPDPSPVGPDLEDALAALDVDLDPQVQEQRRARRQSGQQRPLPGLPVHRPESGPVPIVKPAERPRSPTGANQVARPNSPQRGASGRPTAPPPIPAAARKKATTPPPVPTRPPPKRATTDDGILIDFDEDE